MNTTQAVRISTSDTLRLAGIWHFPKNKTKKAVILAHGITVDKDEDGVFIKLANSLEKAGFAVMRFDFRGHGESDGKSIDMTVSGEMLDLEAVMAYVRKQGYLDVGLLGASFGGGSSTLYASEHQKDIACLCLWNPVLNYDHTFLNPTLPWIKAKKAHMQKDIHEKGWTTLGSRKFVIGKVLFDEMAKYKPYDALQIIKLPTAIIHGTRDTKVPYEDSKKYVSSLQSGSLITIEDAEHGFHEPKERAKAIDATVGFFVSNL